MKELEKVLTYLKEEELTTELIKQKVVNSKSLKNTGLKPEDVVSKKPDSKINLDKKSIIITTAEKGEEGHFISSLEREAINTINQLKQIEPFKSFFEKYNISSVVPKHKKDSGVESEKGNQLEIDIWFPFSAELEKILNKTGIAFYIDGAFHKGNIASNSTFINDSLRDIQNIGDKVSYIPKRISARNKNDVKEQIKQVFENLINLVENKENNFRRKKKEFVDSSDSNVSIYYLIDRLQDRSDRKELDLNYNNGKFKSLIQFLRTDPRAKRSVNKHKKEWFNAANMDKKDFDAWKETHQDKKHKADIPYIDLDTNTPKLFEEIKKTSK